MSVALYPLLFRPVYKDYLWGGDRILRQFHRDEPPGVYAESWEISDRPEGPSIVANGPLAGTALPELIRRHPAELLGDCRASAFPLLLKIIDARETLSVQVHPDDGTAARFGGEAKTEMWYVLAAAPDAAVYCGLLPDTTESVLREAIRTGTADLLLRRVRVRAGDAVFVPGGRVHAIGAGCLLYECQQNSNTTYRLYDWGRVGADGKPRQLHIEEGLRVVRWNDDQAGILPPGLSQRVAPGCRITTVLRVPPFAMERIDLNARWNLQGTGRFAALFVSEGSVVVRGGGTALAVAAGTSVLIPASLTDVSVEAASPSVVLKATA